MREGDAGVGSMLEESPYIWTHARSTLHRKKLLTLLPLLNDRSKPLTIAQLTEAVRVLATLLDELTVATPTRETEADRRAGRVQRPSDATATLDKRYEEAKLLQRKARPKG
jgi:hypothetical protein